MSDIQAETLSRAPDATAGSPSAALFAQAIAHHRAGQLAEAAALYRQVLAADGRDVAALSNLGLLLPPEQGLVLFRHALALRPDYTEALMNMEGALRALGRLEEALPLYEAALAFNPTRADLLCRFGSVLVDLGRFEDATVRFRQAIVLQPDFVAALHNLGAALQHQGQLDEAILHYERTLAYQPDAVSALVNLGTIHAATHRFGPAEKWYRWALMLDPTLVEANLNMVTILESTGRLAEASVFRRRTVNPLPLDVQTAAQETRRVLVLMSRGTGNVPFDTLLPPRLTTRILWYVDHATDEQEATLPPYDIAFNAVGNADLTGSSFARLTQFSDRHPVLNRPEAVEKTRRDKMPALLGDIPSVMVPKVALLRRDEMIEPGLAERLAALGLDGAMIVRPWCTQGGEGAILIETPAQLAGMAISDADASYFIAFHDYRSPDGFFRKYRMLFIDGKPYPYHLAISSKWLVHYISAEMAEHEWKREEEHRFLDDPAAALGAKAMAAIEAIGRRLDLDYAGIDFTLTPDGEVVVFEANATMSLWLVPGSADYEYKSKFVIAMASAFQRMLDDRTAGR